MKVYKRLKETVRPAPEGRHILLMMAHYWGKGPTLEKAFHELREASYGGLNAKTHVIGFHVHPDSYVDGMGGIVSPAGCRPVKVGACNIPDGQRMKHEVY